MGGAHIMAICEVAPNDTGKWKRVPLRFGLMQKGKFSAMFSYK